MYRAKNKTRNIQKWT